MFDQYVHTPLSDEALSVLEDYIVNALFLYFDRIQAPEYMSQFLDDLIVLEEHKHQSSPSDCEDVHKVLIRTMHNLDKLNAPYYGPTGVKGKIQCDHDCDE
jgi:hypothetical protein